MSPDRATMEAARPVCQAVDGVDGEGKATACGRPLRLVTGPAGDLVWTCADHGRRFLARALVAGTAS